MEEIRRKMQIVLKKVFHGNKRQMITAAAACFIVYVLLLSGIFSYFHSEDTVTNRLDAKNGSVMIQEPQWDSIGQYKARASEPGMQIEKDPSGINNGQVDLYIRLVMTVDVSRYDESGKSEEYLANFADNTEKRTKAVLEALRIKGTPDVPLLTQDAVSGNWECNSSDFVFRCETIDGKTAYCFYFTGGDKTGSADMMRIVKPQEQTATLFDYLEIPVYKKDYLGVFDQPYSIHVEAQGVPAAGFPAGLTVEAAAGSESPFAE